MLNIFKKLFFVLFFVVAFSFVIACGEKEDEKTPEEPDVPTVEEPTPDQPGDPTVPEEPTPDQPGDPTVPEEPTPDYSEALKDIPSEVTIKAGETYEVTAELEVKLESNDAEVAAVEGKVIKAVKAGVVTVKVVLVLDETVTKEIAVTVEAVKLVPTEVKFVNAPEVIYMDDLLTLEVVVYPEGVSQEVTWKCINRTKATIDENGAVTPLRSGDAKFTATSKEDSSVVAEVTIDIKSYINPEKFFGQINFENPTVKNFTAFGWQSNWDGTLLSSVTKYCFEDLTYVENWMPEGHADRPGTFMKPYYVTVHDVGGTNASENAEGTSKYCNQVTSTSWHFSTGNDGAWQNLPMDEIGWHAGDGTSVPLEFTDTGIKATSDEAAKVTISNDGYFEMNGEKTTIKAPTKDGGALAKTSDIVYTGINNYVDPKTGTYWIGNTWWSDTYRAVSNRGGNLNSVGIETSVARGSNVFYTWNVTAKLIGTMILPQTGLLPKDVKQHNTFSGKDCPMTMRHANMWETFMQLVETEYKINKYFKSWDIELICDSEYVDSKGLIKTLPDAETEVKYQVKVNDKQGYEKTFDFSFKLPAKSGYTL